MSAERRALRFANEVTLDTAPAELFLARVLEDGLTEVRVDNWSTSGRTLDDVGEPAFRVVWEGRESGLYVDEDATLSLNLCGGRLFAAVAAPTPHAADEALGRLRELFPAPDLVSKHEVPVTFWTYGPHGPQPAWRSIAVPGWEEIRGNYTASTRTDLERLMRGFEPAHGGQLILWHGRAGTGKTFGLRALAWEWREWCEFHYIVDPDAFFGEHADYLISVLLQPGYEAMPMHPGVASLMRMGGELDFAMDLEDEDDDGRASRKPWRVLLLEDTGELLTADARVSMGQGLSRFLNVVDGLIGQGLRVLVLVTTNEEIRRLHPAVARPGRCAANIEFRPLEASEAAEWLERRGVGGAPDQPATLASLYSQLAEFGVAEVEHATGFAPTS